MGKENFWASPAAEPKRAYRWRLLFDNIPQWLCKKVSQPSFEISEHEHKYINHTFWYPGRVTWNEIGLTLVDPLHPDATREMQRILRNSGYVYPSKPEITDTISKSRAVSKLNKFQIDLLGPKGAADKGTGMVVGSWVLRNPWIKSVDFGELDYESDELVNLDIKVRYDWAEYKSSAGD